MYSIGGPLRRKVTRRREVAGANEINITPVMNLFVSLIPFLLISAVFVQISFIETNAPSRSSAKSVASGQTSLAMVVITSSGFTVSGSGPMMRGGTQKMEIPKLGVKQYNYAALTKALSDLKKNDPKADDLLIMTEADITYSTIIETMDAARTSEAGQPLFTKPFFGGVS